MRVSTGVVKLRSTQNGLQFNVPDIIGEAATHLVGKNFRCALISGVDRDVISFTHIRPKNEAPPLRPVKFDPAKESILEIKGVNTKTWAAVPVKVKVEKEAEFQEGDLEYGHEHYKIRHSGRPWDDLDESESAERLFDLNAPCCMGESNSSGDEKLEVRSNHQRANKRSRKLSR